MQSSGIVCSNAVHHANAQNTIEDKALQRYLKSLEREKQIRLTQIQNNQKLFALRRRSSATRLPLTSAGTSTQDKRDSEKISDESKRRPYTAPVKKSLPEYSVYTKGVSKNSKVPERPKTRISNEGKSVKFKGIS